MSTLDTVNVNVNRQLFTQETNNTPRPPLTLIVDPVMYLKNGIPGILAFRFIQWHASGRFKSPLTLNFTAPPRH